MNRHVWQVGMGLLVMIGAVMAAMALIPTGRSFRGTAYEPPVPASEFALAREDGSTFELHAQRGKVVLLFFGYTSCPDVCPVTLSELRKVNEELGLPAGQLQVVFVTVDPGRDTPDRIQKYVAMFNPTFIGLSGSLEDLQLIWSDYGVYREVEQLPNSATGYLVNHTARIYVIDQDGYLRLSYNFDTPTDDIVHDLKLLFR